MLHSLAGATVVTPDLDAAIAAYGTFLNYEGSVETVGADRAAAWGVPEAANARMATLWPASGARRFVRLVEGMPPPDFAPLRTYGWTAIEIVVQDVDLLAERLADSPFEIIGPPAVLEFEFTDQLKAMQVVGPGGEILYLTQIGAQIPGFDLPAAESFVDQPFIMVLASADLPRTGRYFAGLGRDMGPEITAPVKILSEAFGLSHDHRHVLATVAMADCSLFEVDAFPAQTEARPTSSIGLPCGIAMVTVFGEDPHKSDILHGPDGEWLEIL